MSSSAYNPKEVEEKWYPIWEKGGYFQASADSGKKPYTISIPPPNVTGVLHMGHALVDTLQDVLIRWKRMQGYEALWVPGTDHAGIATQTVVERDQIAKLGKRRKDFSRDEFLKLVWEWKEKSEGRILDQLRRLGCSCDWSRLAFTMDETRSKAVRTAFKKMFDEGLIYRGDYLVNWDPVTQTALADDEVEYEEKESHLWHLRYPLSNGSGELIIATTRPETMLGDTAVAVSPKDERYAAFVGKTISHPFTGRQIPIIADDFVDPEFGTGAVKITPAHDPNDYEMGFRHDLPMITMMTPDGKINELGGEFEGLTMEEGRLKMVAKFKELGVLVKTETHTHRVGLSYRSKAIIEPYLSKQWFVKMGPFKEKLISAVKEGKVQIIPKDWESTYFHWIENLRDWCISRQLWWGHQIPVWYNKGDPDKLICSAGDGLPPEVAESPEQWERDEDVLDTWYSSALWPFSILGWPERTADLAKFYPNSVLVTGHDILFFWVARMLLMGEYILGELPFPDTFLHGLIFGKSYWREDAQGGIDYVTPKERLAFDLGEKILPDVHSKWEKMSKSKGNIIDPLEIIDTYGTDAMRIALCSSATHARQIDLDRRRFEEFKNFINKIWNGARFVFMNIEDLSTASLAQGINRSLLTLEDKWILSRMNALIGQINKHLTSYTFDRAAQETYHFFWDEFCSAYVELVKPTLFGKVGTAELKVNKQRILTVVLCNLIRLFHPMVPFVTEELFTTLKNTFPEKGGCDDPYVTETLTALASPACIVAPYPTSICTDDINAAVEEEFALITEVIGALRNIRAEMQISPGVSTDLIVEADPNSPSFVCLQSNLNMVRALVRLNDVQLTKSAIVEGFSASKYVSNLKLIVPLPEELREKERQRLVKEKEKLAGNQKQLTGKLSNKNFVDRAPKELVEQTRQLLENTQLQLKEIETKLNSF